MNAIFSPVENLLAWYQNLSRESLARIDEFYTEDAFFKDPFNEFRSREKIGRVFEHMFDTLDEPRFVITSTVSENGRSFIIWDMKFALQGKAMTIHGCSHLVFAADGRVEYHRDYWDAAEELYEKIRVLGWLMKRLKRKLQLPQG
jgi:hypothetical protein